ncbi:Transcription factor Atoh8 [Anthophora retusa]
MTHHVVESVSELSAMMKADGAMAGSERDAGFCSGGDDDDMSTDLHSPSASEDSLEVQVTPISLKNKRKLAEPRKIQEINSAPLKKRRFERIEEEIVPDEESTRTVRSPSPFRPWSCTSKNVDSKMSLSVSIERSNTTGQPSVFSLLSPTMPVTSNRINHHHLPRHHRNVDENDCGGGGGDDGDDDDDDDDADNDYDDDDADNDYDDDDKSNDGNNNVQRVDQINNVHKNGSKDKDVCERTEGGDSIEKQQRESHNRESLAARVRQLTQTRSTRAEKRELSRQKFDTTTVSSSSSTTIVSEATTLSTSTTSLPPITHSRLQEEPLSLVLRGDVTSRVPSHPAVNGHTRQHPTPGQQRNYKNMTRERRIEANARERTRVHTISAAFDTLRRAIPAYSHNQKLSKLSVLRIACSYIMTLGKIVNTPEDEATNGASLGACVDLVSRTIQTEGKLRKRKED